MKKARNEKFKWSIFIALIVGLLYLAPHIYFSYTSKYYNPLSTQVGNLHIDEALYAAGIMEVLEGRLVPSDLNVYEHKGNIFFFDPLPFIIMSAPALLIGIKNTIVLSYFVFSIAAFLLFYYLSFLFLKNKQLSVISGLVLLFFHQLFVPPRISLAEIYNHLTANLLNLGEKPISLFLARFVQPQVSIIFYFLTIILLYLSLKKNKLIYYILTGLCFALTFYSYFYYWTYLLVFLTLVFLLSAFKKQTDKIKGLLVSIFLGIFLAIPYFINLIKVKSFEITARTAIEIGHFIETISLFYFLLYGLFYFICKKKDENFRLFSLLYFSGIVCLNIQLLFGFTIQNNHWNSRAIIPVFIIFLLYSLKEVYERLNLHSKMKQYSKPLLLASIIMLILLATNIQFQNVKKLHNKYSFSDSEYELVQWLSKNTPKDSVILTTNLTWNFWIPAYTKNNVYFPYGVASLCSNKEMIERFILTYKLFNISDEHVEEKLLANSAYQRTANEPLDYSFDSYLKSYILVDMPFPIKHKGMYKYYGYNESVVLDIINQYRNYQFDIKNIKKYKVDYVLLTNFDKQFVNLAQKKEYPFNNVVFENKDYKLFKI